jgi:chaperonin GroES
LILPDDSEKMSAGGILLALRTEEDVQKGTVVAVGTGALTKDGVLIPMEIKMGNKVMFDRRRIIKIEHEGKKYFFASESEVLAIVE